MLGELIVYVFAPSTIVSAPAVLFAAMMASGRLIRPSVPGKLAMFSVAGSYSPVRPLGSSGIDAAPGTSITMLVVVTVIVAAPRVPHRQSAASSDSRVMDVP
ncbi:MAG: hypothetical protein DPW14_06620 [Planctomycetes bacterium]|nr:hypothetical protein [Planctomycetota bacterium]